MEVQAAEQHQKRSLGPQLTVSGQVVHRRPLSKKIVFYDIVLDSAVALPTPPTAAGVAGSSAAAGGARTGEPPAPAPAGSGGSAEAGASAAAGATSRSGARVGGGPPASAPAAVSSGGTAEAGASAAAGAISCSGARVGGGPSASGAVSESSGGAGVPAGAANDGALAPLRTVTTMELIAKLSVYGDVSAIMELRGRINLGDSIRACGNFDHE
ncbi:hypothetical protein FOA52_007453 [Chlamydomonas sp. UWO 241]|nr:hypothetical protein FOA52_007453 [Chlamydomonas sp. UWO 241]